VTPIMPSNHGESGTEEWTQARGDAVPFLAGIPNQHRVAGWLCGSALSALRRRTVLADALDGAALLRCFEP